MRAFGFSYSLLKDVSFRRRMQIAFLFKARFARPSLIRFRARGRLQKDQRPASETPREVARGSFARGGRRQEERLLDEPGEGEALHPEQHGGGGAEIFGECFD